MSETNFNFSETFNKYEDKIGQITNNTIEIIKSNQHLSKSQMTELILIKAKELEEKLLDELYQFANLCINSTEQERIKELRNTNPVFLINYVMALNKPKLRQLMDFYDYDANIVLNHCKS